MKKLGMVFFICPGNVVNIIDNSLNQSGINDVQVLVTKMVPIINNKTIQVFSSDETSVTQVAGIIDDTLGTRCTYFDEMDERMNCKSTLGYAERIDEIIGWLERDTEVIIFAVPNKFTSVLANNFISKHSSEGIKAKEVYNCHALCCNTASEPLLRVLTPYD